MESFTYIKKTDNTHYLIHIITEQFKYFDKISNNIYNFLMCDNVIKSSNDVVIIFEIDPYEEMNNITCIKHMTNNNNVECNKKELATIFTKIMNSKLVGDKYTIIYNYETTGYLSIKTDKFNSLLNLSVGVNNFMIENIHYVGTKRLFA
jgi:hypothetical protein